MIECPCGKRVDREVEGSVNARVMLTSAGWRWSSAFSRWLCRECFDGVLAIAIHHNLRDRRAS